MNFLTDSDGVTKKDIAFMIVMLSYNKDGLSPEVLSLLTMIFDTIGKLTFVVVTFFYGSTFLSSVFGKFGFKSASTNIVEEVVDAIDETSYEG